MEHTPGPWATEVDPETRELNIVSNRRPYIAIVLTEDVWDEQCAANARLIACAPDMLRALQRIVHPMADDDDLEYAKEIIAKAEGMPSDADFLAALGPCDK